MREISPAKNLSSGEFFARLPPAFQRLIAEIRAQKVEGTRPRPSTTLLDQSNLLVAERRRTLLDKVAELVDENLSGRADMCSQYAELLALALNDLGLAARTVAGNATYYNAKGSELFEWPHVWVRVGSEVIDGNVDCLFENPAVPKTVQIAPYWGPIKTTPTDRRLRERLGAHVDADEDVATIWWPELRAWLEMQK